MAHEHAGLTAFFADAHVGAGYARDIGAPVASVSRRHGLLLQGAQSCELFLEFFQH